MAQNEVQKTLVNVNEVLSFLAERNIDYVSEKGKAYIDGLEYAGYKFKFISVTKYSQLEEKCKYLEKHCEDLKSQIKKLDERLQRKKKSWL